MFAGTLSRASRRITAHPPPCTARPALALKIGSPGFRIRVISAGRQGNHSPARPRQARACRAVSRGLVTRTPGLAGEQDDSVLTAIPCDDAQRDIARPVFQRLPAAAGRRHPRPGAARRDGLAGPPADRRDRRPELTDREGRHRLPVGQPARRCRSPGGAGRSRACWSTANPRAHPSPNSVAAATGMHLVIAEKAFDR